MSYYNNSQNYYVNPSQPEYDHHQSSYSEHVNQPSYSGGSNEQRFMVNNSTLEPTAPEFQPAESRLGINNGTVKKKPQNKGNYYNRRGNNRYGSGRTFSSSRFDYYEDGNYGRNNERTDDFASENYQQDEDAASVVSQNSQAHGARGTKPSTNSSSYSSRENSRKHSNKLYQQNDYQSDNRHNKNNPNRGAGNDYSYSDNMETNPGKQFSSSNPRNNPKYYGDGRSYRSNVKSYDARSSNNFYDKPFNSRSTNNYYERSNADSDESYGNQRYNKFYDKLDNRANNGKYDGKRQFEKNKDSWRKSNNSKQTRDLILSNKKLDAASQRERLEGMLNRRQLECLVCCEKIKNSDKVWSCIQCYNILHLNCIVAWAKSSKVENGWRCPACQNVCSEVPNQYKCYCKKTVEPRVDPGIIPHGCGEMCLRKGRTCDHKCTILCHPGPCPDCSVMVAKSCGCGATKPIVKCSSDVEIVCDAICNKILECGMHKCKSRCHSGKCNSCEELLIQECYCGKVGRRVACSAEFNGATKYCCDDVCQKLLTCGNHKCERKCHEGPCDPCARDVNHIVTCPCGKSKLEKVRSSCLDPIPCCGKVCGKMLNCGQPNSPHICKSPCHPGDCPSCPLTTLVRCRCGHMDKELPCLQLTTKADDARCEKKCTKKRLCGKHRCNQRCCIEVDHYCPLPCNHQLSCGQHRCSLTCHSGRCPSCIETSFEELYCECGASVIYPPVPCGTKPPTCNKPCSRQRPCGHDSNHSCHTGVCPPCTVLCKRWCYGHHEQRSAIPCHQQDFSCGLPCGKKMPCGRHNCMKPCHDKACPLPCRQPCLVPRQLCGHPCGRPCHNPPCPETVCKQNVTITCLCGLVKSSKPCTEVADEFRIIEMGQIKDKIGDLSKDQTVDITDIVSKHKKPAILKILECNDDCRVLERNRRLAIGLQIRNPDLSQKLTPRYTDFMRGWAKKDAHFCQRVHDKLTELVQLAKQSKQKSRSYSFESMNRDKRHFIHEYCEHFGCESAAYDMEPNRNIVATAIKDKSWLPGMSLLEVIQRENGQRKVPGPVFSKSATSKSETVSLKLPGRAQKPNTPPAEMVDYFEYPPV